VLVVGGQKGHLGVSKEEGQMEKIERKSIGKRFEKLLYGCLKSVNLVLKLIALG